MIKSPPVPLSPHKCHTYMEEVVVDGVRNASFRLGEELSIAVQWLQFMQKIFQN